MESYLIEQYDVFEDVKWLTDAKDIEDYFTDNGRDFLDCGQGFYQDEASVICKVGDRFYEVNISAEITSAKQDVGDRLYWVEDITNVTYKEIEKPVPKDVEKTTYTVTLTEEQRRNLEQYMDDNYMRYKAV